MLNYKETPVTRDQLETLKTKQSERETTVNFCSTDPTAYLYTLDPKMMTKIKSLMKSSPESFTVYEASRTPDGQLTGYFVEFNKELLKISSKVRTINKKN